MTYVQVKARTIGSTENEAIRERYSRNSVIPAALTQRLYEKIFALHRGKPDQGCPSGADKVAGKGKWYTLSFTQWDLPVLGIEAYEGSCKLVSFNVDGQVLLGDQEFWDLVHRLENSSAH